MSFVLKNMEQYVTTTFELGGVERCAYFKAVDVRGETIIKLFPSNFYVVGQYHGDIYGVNFSSENVLFFKLEKTDVAMIMKISGTDKWLGIHGGRLSIVDTPFKFEYEHRDIHEIISSVPRLPVKDDYVDEFVIFDILYHHHLLFYVFVTAGDNRTFGTFLKVGDTTLGTRYRCTVPLNSQKELMKFQNFLSHDNLRRGTKETFYIVRATIAGQRVDLCREVMGGKITEESLNIFYTPKIEGYLSILRMYYPDVKIETLIVPGEKLLSEGQRGAEIRERLLQEIKGQFFQEFNGASSPEERAAITEKFRLKAQIIRRETENP